MKDIKMSYNDKTLYEAWLATTNMLMRAIDREEENADFEDGAIISQSVYGPVWRAYNVISRIYNDDMMIIQ